MKKLMPLLLLLSCFSTLLSAQTDIEKAQELTSQAIELMDNGKIAESLVLLEEAKTLDSTSYVYDYEICFAHQLNKDYEKAIQIGETIFEKYNDYSYQLYQLIGNSYDLNGDPEKALETYREGIDKFPEAGPLYLESGVVAAATNINLAVKYWEEGVVAAPFYSSNYYHLARIFARTEELVYGLIYGEIFLNLEVNTERTLEISTLLFEMYQKGMSIEKRKKFTASYSKSSNMSLHADDVTIEFPIGLLYNTNMFIAFEPILAEFPKKKIELEVLDVIRARENFTEFWGATKATKNQPVFIFDWQKQVAEAGHSEAYNHWVLQEANGLYFEGWYQKNEEKFKAFAEWFSATELPLSKENVFVR